MSQIRIRDATVTDLESLCALLAQLADAGAAVPAGPGEVAALEAMLQTPGLRLLVAEQDDGRVLGTLTIVVVPNLSHGARPWAQLENMVVEAGVRGSGAGKRLMDEALETVQAAGCYKVQLQSANRRSGAHAFYEREGFSASSRGYRRYLDAR